MSGNGESLPPIIESATSPVLDTSGSFVPNTEAGFFFTFVDLFGQSYDPYEMTLTITDPNGTVVKTADALDKIEIGKWAYLWTVPSDSTAGKYTLTLTYITETIDGPTTQTYTEYFLVVERGSGAVTLREVASRRFLEALIGYSQRIPIWNETIRLNKARTVGKLSFPRWNQTAGAEVFLNGETVESGYEIDWWRGRVAFTNPLASFDEAWCSYNFRWFTDDELDSFLEQGVNEFNIYPPQSVYTIGNIEDRWVIVALYGAAINAIRRWMIDIQFMEPAKIFGTLTRAHEVFGAMDTLKKNYEDHFFKLLDQKKYQPYAGLTKTITVPEYTLPGGRSRWFRYLFSST